MSEIKKLVLDDPDTQSADIIGDNIQALEALFPEAFKEGGIDFDVLKQLLGATVDEKDEKYGLNWHGKRKARQIALTPSTGTLLPCPDESVDWDTTQNLMIEGDNLEVLKLLQKSYAGKVKLIYIDPPYNTGKDFVYPDDFQDSIKSYLSLTRQIDEGGTRATSNTETSGRFHTDWLSMIYPRLKLARSLLKNDGVIFISIDDGEVANMRKVCDEIFGEECFIAQIVWEKMYTTKNDAASVSQSHEYVLVYLKTPDHSIIQLLPRTAEMDARYTNSDNDPRGPWKAIPLYAKGERKNGRYPVVSPSTGKEHWPGPDSHWLYSREDTEKLIEENRISFGRDGNALPNVKRFLSEVQQGTKARTLWKHNEVGTNDSAKRELRELYHDDKLPFDFPKPTTLISRMITLATRSSEHDIVLDFFAGSGTTAHATLIQNASDNGNRRYILVQLPEALDPENKEQKFAFDFCKKLGRPTNIAELTKDRIGRASAKIAAENAIFKGDLGYRVYKLAPSNIVAWEPEVADLEGTLLANAEHLVAGRTEQDVLYELLLKLGLDLCVPIERKDIAGKAVHSIGGGALIVCLADGLTKDTVETVANGIVAWWKELASAVDTRVVFKDSGFADDVAKANMAAILNQNGILDVRSL